MEPIKQVYVIERLLPDEDSARGLDTELDRAERFRKSIGGEIRVFEEAAVWRTDEPPPHRREVLALFKPSPLFGPRVIVACFGSESKWIAYDHDRRSTYLSKGTVVGWRELPEISR